MPQSVYDWLKPIDIIDKSVFLYRSPSEKLEETQQNEHCAHGSENSAGNSSSFTAVFWDQVFWDQHEELV